MLGVRRQDAPASRVVLEILACPGGVRDIGCTLPRHARDDVAVGCALPLRLLYLVILGPFSLQLTDDGLDLACLLRLIHLLLGLNAPCLARPFNSRHGLDLRL